MSADAACAWSQLEPILSGVERPSRYIDREWGASHAEGSYRAVLAYPDAYEIGQANQALAILYGALSRVDGVAVERVFVPWIDLSAAMREQGIPLPSLESGLAVSEADLLGITLPYELTYTNILELLDLAGIPIRGVDRTLEHPIVVGGGPCAFNPEPVAPFFDAIVLGDGEDAVVDVVRVHREAKASGASRDDLLAELARVPGVYVPSLHTPSPEREGTDPPLVVKRVVSHLPTAETPPCRIVPFAEVVHDRLTVEVLRGCSRGCRFCQAGMVYRPVRERAADDIVRDVTAGLACTGHDEVSLTSLSTTDHSAIEEILRRLSKRLAGTGVTVSVPSLRADAFGLDLARLVSGGRKSGLTFAPEAGTQRLRDVINKNVTEEDMLDTVQRSFSAGWRRVKLYFMIGLPSETDEDVIAIADLVSRVLRTAREHCAPQDRGSIRISVSVSTFVPKAHTPFQWDAQVTLPEVRRRQGLLREHMPRKGVDLSWHDAEVSFLEGVLSRGDRSIADAIEAAWGAGSRFDAWTEHFRLQRWLDAFEATGVDAARFAHRERAYDEVLPWSHLSAGLDAAFLRDERERGLTGTTTADCTFEGCSACGVCDGLGVDLVLEGRRGG